MHTDFNTSQLLGKEHALLICNHRSDMDWLIGWVLAQRAGCLGSALAIMKKERKILPIIGWSMWFSGYIFLERCWIKDESTLKSGFRQLEDFPMPFWLALFVEGTCFTQQKLALAQEFAASRGLPAPRNVLIPRTKVVIFWFCLIVLGIVEFVGWSTLLSTWEGIAIAFSYLVLVTIIMQILIHSSESERSTPAKLSSEDPIKQSLIQKHAENNTTLAI